MKQLFVFLGLVAFVMACGGGDSVSPEMLAAAEKTYKQHCVVCHGPDGKLALNGAKKFSESTLSQGERETVIKNGRNLMTAFGGILKPEEIKAVAAYTIELGKK